MKLGFTGTQRGMTRPQWEALALWLDSRADRFFEFHHGDCVGADAEFHKWLLAYGALEPVTVVIHPPVVSTKRAYVTRAWAAKWMTIHVRDERPYLVRNRAIVDETNVLYAAPGEAVEQLRSGTWATVRYARKLKRAIRFFWPDGTTSVDGQRRAA